MKRIYWKLCFGAPLICSLVLGVLPVSSISASTNNGITVSRGSRKIVKRAIPDFGDAIHIYANPSFSSQSVYKSRANTVGTGQNMSEAMLALLEKKLNEVELSVNASLVVLDNLREELNTTQGNITLELSRINETMNENKKFELHISAREEIWNKTQATIEKQVDTLSILHKNVSGLQIFLAEKVENKRQQDIQDKNQTIRIAELENLLEIYFNTTTVFFAQRNSSYYKKGTIIPYTKSTLNKPQNSFNPSTGIFTAPFSGDYYFYFSAIKTKAQAAGTTRLTVQLQRIANGNSSNQVLTEGHINSNEYYGWFPLHVQATVFLEKNQRVGVQLIEGAIHENGVEEHPVTAFGGFLIGLSSK